MYYFSRCAASFKLTRAVDPPPDAPRPSIRAGGIPS